jgi:hypothetical protein
MLHRYALNLHRKGKFGNGNMKNFQFQQRQFATSAGPVYRTVMKTNARYVAFILVGAAVLEGIYGGFTQRVWEVINRGKV